MTRRVAVTGASGFVGLHAMLRLTREPGVTPVGVARADFSSAAALRETLADVDVVIHLAGRNRGTDREVEATNVALTERLVAALPAESTTRVVFASSTQRALDNPYGRSKRAAEDVLRNARGVQAVIAEIANVFGPGCRPFYNSVVATFCHQLARGEDPRVDVDKELELLWVVDLADALAALALAEHPPPEVRPGPTHPITVTGLLAELRRVHDVHFEQRHVPDLPTPLSGHLYRTLVTYAPPDGHAYQPPRFADERGFLFECVKQLAGGGQIFFSTTKPGVTRGNHYHTRKYEKFCVVQGEGTVRLRWMGGERVLEYPVCGADPTVVDIPLFHTHAIENTGDADMLTLFWANEIFDHDDSDTFAADVR